MRRIGLAGNAPAFSCPPDRRLRLSASSPFASRSRRQDSHLLSETSRVPISTASTSPRSLKGNGSDGTCTHLTLLARQHRPCGTCAPFTKGKMAGSEGIEPSKHEIWSLAAIPTRRQPAYKHFFPLPLVTAPANAIQKVEAPHTTSTCTTQDSVSWPPGSKAYWQHAFS